MTKPNMLAESEPAQSSRLITTSPGAPTSGTNSAAAVRLPPPDAIVARIRSEYREMPGLRLTLAQASRLWQLDLGECEVVLQSLVAEQFLDRTVDGAFIALPTPRSGATPAKAALVAGRQLASGGFLGSVVKT